MKHWIFFCLVVLIGYSIHPVLAGQGCGTNWMGDTSGDTEFYVSKNQNQGSSGTATSSGTSAAEKPAVALGSTVSRAQPASLIESLTPGKASPQAAGTAIVWTANATASGGQGLLYDFLLKGPSTNGQLIDETGWTDRNTWTWNTTAKDAGESQIEVRVKYPSSKDFDDRKALSYSIVAQSSGAGSGTATAGTAITQDGIDGHPASKTAGSITAKPRTAPDELRQTPAVNTDIIGANMNMPDPTPKAPAQSGSADVVQAAAAGPESEQSKIMDVSGKWSMRLENLGSSMDLILIQTGESLMGSGSLNEQGTKLPLYAKGSVAGNTFDLDVKTVVGEYVNKIDKRFSLNLVKVDRVVSGSYEAYAGEDLTGKGNVTASRFGA